MQKFLECEVTRVITVVKVISAISLVVNLLQADYGSLLNCADWTAHPFTGHFLDEWLLFILNTIFLIRVFLSFIANNFSPYFVHTVLDTWLFVQSLISLMLGKYFYGFQFLVFHRVLSAYFSEAIRRIFSRLNFGSTVHIVLLVFQGAASLCLVAGLIQTAEEWTAESGIHESSEGEITNIRNYGEYLYFATITLSTVGYGDISPSTYFGRVVILTLILTCVPIFVAKS